jgi:quinol monooxygenase YgiN
MLDERELHNRIERVPAAPDRLLAIRTFTGSDFASRWEEYAAAQVKQDGCLFLRLHRDLEKTGQYVTWDLWKSRYRLIEAIRAMPFSDDPEHETFVRVITHVPGTLSKPQQAKAGQVASVRHFYLKVGTEPQFEQLWAQSARAEARQALYKRLHRDLNLATHYVSYSLWTDQAALEAAASGHAHWQEEHEPYPLASAVVRQVLEVLSNWQ